MKITPAQRKEINSDLAAIRYSDTLLDKLNIVLQDSGLVLLDEEGQRFEGVFCGDDGKAVFDLELNGEYIDNALLIFYWHKMESGRFEITAYIS